jgi:hypothetical protein
MSHKMALYKSRVAKIGSYALLGAENSPKEQCGPRKVAPKGTRVVRARFDLLAWISVFKTVPHGQCVRGPQAVRAAVGREGWDGRELSSSSQPRLTGSLSMRPPRATIRARRRALTPQRGQRLWAVYPTGVRPVRPCCRCSPESPSERNATVKREKRYVAGHQCGPRLTLSAERCIDSFEQGQAVLKSSESPFSLIIASPPDTRVGTGCLSPVRAGDAQQAESVRQILPGAAINLGVSPTVQGHGLPWRRSRCHLRD